MKDIETEITFFFLVLEDRTLLLLLLSGELCEGAGLGDVDD